MPPPGLGYTWPEGATIVVYIDPSIPLGFKSAIIAAFQNWSRAGGSGVRFAGFVENAELARTPGDGAVGVRMEDLGDVDAAIGHFPPGLHGYLATGTIRINNRVRDVRTVANLASHEIGHSFISETASSASAARRP